jgi:hypothetical protein
MGIDFTGAGSIADLLKDGVDKIWPDPLEAAKAKTMILNAQQSGALKQMDADLQLNIEQIKANAIAEAKPGVSFRDGAGWLCVVGLGFALAKAPIEWGFTFAGHPITLPSVDTSVITTMLFALLGLGGMHVYDKNAK